MARAPARAYLTVLRRAGRFADCSTGAASVAPAAAGGESTGDAYAATTAAAGWALVARGAAPVVAPVGRPALRAGAGRATRRLRTRQTTAMSTPVPSVNSVRRRPVR